MKTPIVDFVRAYAAQNISRLHMPGHKGHSFLGCEPFDLTEIAGADSLYEADGIIAQSEKTPVNCLVLHIRFILRRGLRSAFAQCCILLCGATRRTLCSVLVFWLRATRIKLYYMRRLYWI